MAAFHQLTIDGQSEPYVTNKARAKGTYWNERLAQWLNQWWPDAERRAQYGTLDRGDITGIRKVVIEAKNTQGWADISGAVVEAQQEAGNAKADVYFVAKPRKGYQVGRCYAVTDLDTMVALLRKAGY